MYLIEEEKIEELSRIRYIISKLSFIIIMDLILKCIWLYGINLFLVYSIIFSGFLIDRFDRITVFLIRNFEINQMDRVEILNYDNLIFRRVDDGGD